MVISEKTLEEIKCLIGEKRLGEALGNIDKILNYYRFDMTNQRDFKLHEKLLSLRITANTLSGKEDETMRFISWKTKYPYEKRVELGEDKYVSLIDANIALYKTDAYINTIHKEKLFSYAGQSFSEEFRYKIGDEEISRQLSLQKENSSYIYMDHPSLPAQKSYHIPCIYGSSNKVDDDALVRGIRDILNDVQMEKLKRVAFVALTMEALRPEDERRATVNKIAKEISRVVGAERYSGPEISFVFVGIDSFSLFQDVFETYSPIGRFVERTKAKINESLKLLIDETGTKNSEYISNLKKASHFLSDSSGILIMGERGSGKTQLAEGIHRISEKKGLEVRSLNCAILTPEQLWVTFFGSTVRNSQYGQGGLLGSNKVGTIFLDEIQRSELRFQEALLHYLDKGEYWKPGDQKTVKSDIRLIFGTSQNLEAKVRERSFLPELYDRISQRTISIPPLRKRREDIPLLANRKVSQLNKDRSPECEDEERGVIRLSVQEEALEEVKKYNWYGNLRQLELYVENLYYQCLETGEALITIDQILNNPPLNYKTSVDENSNRLDSLRSLFREILSGWEEDEKFKDKKFLRDFIEPVAAKVFLEDLKNKYKKEDSARILGLDRSRGSKSTADMRAAAYSELEKLFEE